MAFSLKLRSASGELLNLDFLWFVASTGIVAAFSQWLPGGDGEALTSGESQNAMAGRTP
jgi:hypothetical protein